ncbi:MAG: hypothetical protein HXX20_17780 [Chloroflexi bacterium]|nr:hypothetical protein [Chloroflexota bacterium]
MDRVITSDKLPLAIQHIAAQHLEGLLICMMANERSTLLYFYQGQLLYVYAIGESQNASKVLDSLLNSHSFKLSWEPVVVSPFRCNVSAETRTAFEEVIQLLIEEGHFEDQQPHKLEATFWEPSGLSDTLEVVEHLSQTLPVTEVAPDLPEQSYILEVNLLLPAGEHLPQLEEVLGRLKLSEQITALSGINLTGYAYYPLKKNGNLYGGFGLVVFYEGNVTDLICDPGDDVAWHYNLNAYELLSELCLAPQVYRVAPSILRASRALIQSKESLYQLKPTSENFLRSVKSLQESRRDGVIIFYVDTLRLHYFFLFECGVQLGVFSPDPKTGCLQVLNTPIALPAENPSASLTVMLANEPVDLFNPAPLALATQRNGRGLTAELSSALLDKTYSAKLAGLLPGHEKMHPLHHNTRSLLFNPIHDNPFSF